MASVVALVSPLAYLNERGDRIERRPDGWEWWSVVPPAGSERKARARCRVKAVVQIALAEGWEMRVR